MKGIITELGKKRHERDVILVRHFPTPLNDKDVSRGWTPTPIDGNYFEDAIDLGRRLKTAGIGGIVASDLQRTLQTAWYISLGSGAPILKTTTSLHTWNPGKLTGKPTDKVDPILEEMAVEAPDTPVEGGESFNEFKMRFLIGLIAILNEFPDKLLVVCTHGRNLALLHAWEEMEYPDDLEVSPEHLGYEDFEPGSAHLFTIHSELLCHN